MAVYLARVGMFRQLDEFLQYSNKCKIIRYVSHKTFLQKVFVNKNNVVPFISYVATAEEDPLIVVFIPLLE